MRLGLRFKAYGLEPQGVSFKAHGFEFYLDFYLKFDAPGVGFRAPAFEVF